jgi:hypothetical protein
MQVETDHVALSSVLELPITTFQIVQSQNVIEDSWLTRSDVEPKLEQNQEGVFILTVYAQGEHGTFEIPYISYHLVHVDEELVAILVAFHGTEAYRRKRDRRVTKGQFYRFYQRDDNGIWSRVNWKQLDEESRKTVLAAIPEQAPAWAKVPGKLEEEYGKPNRPVKTISYKLVRVIDGRYFSVYKPDEEYEIGKLKVQQAKKHHGGGYYSYPDAKVLLQLFHDKMLFSYRVYKEPLQLALLEVEITGRIIQYSNGKWASTFLRPLSVLSTVEYSPN